MADSHVVEQKLTQIIHKLNFNKNNNNLLDTQNRLVVATGRNGMGKMGEGDQYVKTSDYHFWDVMYYIVIVVNKTMLYVWQLIRDQIFLLRVDIKYSQHKKKNVII